MIPMAPAVHAIAQLLALRIVDSLAWGTIIVIFAALVLRATRQTASTRFAVWFSALIAIGLLPLISGAWWPRQGMLAGTVSRPVIMLPDQWALYLFAAWGLIAGWFVAGVGRAVWRLHALRRDCVAIDPATLDPLLQQTLRRHSSREVALCTSEQVRVPTAIGLLRPAVIIPAWVMRDLNPAELSQILVHELAHLRRRDDWTNLAQQIVKAFFFFHPAVWWIEKKVALEREMACDDAVLAEIGSPRAYAECLAHLAEKSFVQRSVVLAQAALGKLRQTSLRVAQILDVNRPVGTARGWKPAVSLVAVCAIACAVWSSRAPRLIAFQDSALLRATGPAVASVSPRVVTENVSYPIPRTPGSALQMPAGPLPKMNAVRNRHNSAIVERNAALRPASSKHAADMVHLTSTESTALPFTEAVFVVIEDGGAGSPGLRVYQIQMFRVTILHQSVEPASIRTPRKET